jgi:hypothetical protein
MTPTLAAFLEHHGFAADNLSALQADGRFTPLMRAAKEGRLDDRRGTAALGVDLAVTNADGCNALWLACYNGSHAIIETLIAAGIDIDRQNGNGASALMYVSSNSKPDLVKLLLEKGANPKLKNFDDFSIGARPGRVSVDAHACNKCGLLEDNLAGQNITAAEGIFKHDHPACQKVAGRCQGAVRLLPAVVRLFLCRQVLSQQAGKQYPADSANRAGYPQFLQRRVAGVACADVQPALRQGAQSSFLVRPRNGNLADQRRQV